MQKNKQELTEWEGESGMKIEWMSLKEGFNLLTWENKREFLDKIKEYVSGVS